MEEITMLASGSFPEHEAWGNATVGMLLDVLEPLDRKSTRLNSSH